MLKVRLLNDGGYGDMENVKFPVIVEGMYLENDLYGVSGSELLRVGAFKFNQEGDELWDPDYRYNFKIGTECEVVEDDC